MKDGGVVPDFKNVESDSGFRKAAFVRLLGLACNDSNPDRIPLGPEAFCCHFESKV